MCGLVEQLKNGLPEGTIVKRCSKEGCKVPLKNAPSPHLLMDLDHPYFDLKDKTHCDFLFISCDCNGGDNWAMPLELKRGSPDATEMVSQLQAGSGVAEARIPDEHKTHFLPVGAYGGRLHITQRDKLRKSRVSFRRKEYQIKLIRCGTPLKNSLLRSSSAK